MNCILFGLNGHGLGPHLSELHLHQNGLSKRVFVVHRRPERLHRVIQTLFVRFVRHLRRLSLSDDARNVANGSFHLVLGLHRSIFRPVGLHSRVRVESNNASILSWRFRNVGNRRSGYGLQQDRSRLRRLVLQRIRLLTGLFSTYLNSRIGTVERQLSF